MLNLKSTVLAAAVALGAAAWAQAQPVVAVPDSPADRDAPAVIVAPEAPPADTQLMIVVPQPAPDPAADAKCRRVLPADYWDCVNSHNGS